MSRELRYDYSPITDREFDLPGGANIAVWVVPNVEYFEFGVPSTPFYPLSSNPEPDVLNYGWRDYGNRVGIWRIMDILDRYGLRATVALNSDICEHHPEIVTAGLERDWEFMGHGRTNSVRMANMAEADERAYIRTTRDRIAETVGEPPRGWLGPALTETYATPDILAGYGFEYVCDWCNDDQPYPLRVDEGRLLSVPYSIEVNDIPLFLRQGQPAHEFERTVVDQFDVLYEEGKEPGNGKVMAISLHPFIMGLPFRSKYLDRALAHITKHQDVWYPTGSELADHYYENYADA